MAWKWPRGIRKCYSTPRLSGTKVIGEKTAIREARGRWGPGEEIGFGSRKVKGLDTDEFG